MARLIKGLAARIVNVLLAFDCFAFSFCTLGGAYTSESFSSAAYRAELHGRFYGKARPVIDWLFSLLGQKDHCKTAYECAKLNLPEDMRNQDQTPQAAVRNEIEPQVDLRCFTNNSGSNPQHED